MTPVVLNFEDLHSQEMHPRIDEVIKVHSLFVFHLFMSDDARELECSSLAESAKFRQLVVGYHAASRGRVVNLVPCLKSCSYLKSSSSDLTCNISTNTAVGMIGGHNISTNTNETTVVETWKLHLVSQARYNFDRPKLPPAVLQNPWCNSECHKKTQSVATEQSKIYMRPEALYWRNICPGCRQCIDAYSPLQRTETKEKQQSEVATILSSTAGCFFYLLQSDTDSTRDTKYDCRIHYYSLVAVMIPSVFLARRLLHGAFGRLVRQVSLKPNLVNIMLLLILQAITWWPESLAHL